MKRKFVDKEEEAFVKDWEAGKYKRMEISPEKLKEIQAAARAAITKSKQISVRINELVLYGLKARALIKKKRFHTFLGEVLHREAQKAA
jgi:hypothetical protein